MSFFDGVALWTGRIWWVCVAGVGFAFAISGALHIVKLWAAGKNGSSPSAGTGNLYLLPGRSPYLYDQDGGVS